jgi:3-oxoacyl-[acyl-carrier protein] reductase
VDLAGKTAIVTGASRGIGRMYALALAGAGAKVVVAARTEREQALAAEPAQLPGEYHRGRAAAVFEGALPGTIYETAETIRAAGGRALPVRCDVTNEEDVKAMVAQARAQFGPVDILVNNAGVFARFNYLEVTPEIFDRVFHVNVLGPYLCARHVLPEMIERRSGSIINITTGSRNLANYQLLAAQGIICYTVTKAALNRLTTYLAQEVAPYGVAVNALAPGFVHTGGGEATLPEDYNWENPEVDWKPLTLEVVAPALLQLAQQTAETFTGKIVFADEFGTPDWGKPYP